MLLSYFALRSSNEKRRALWASFLDESVTCVMPVTPYRSFPASEVQVSQCQRTIMGIDGIIADTASLHVLLNSLVDRSKYPDGVIQFRYTLVAEEAVVAGNQIMARWKMSTTNATSLGAHQEVVKLGMLCVRFNSAHKVVSMDLMFDVMAFMLQLKQSAAKTVFNVVPNTVQTCTGPFGEAPSVMTMAERPYTIVQVNNAWEEMTGFKADDVVMKASCKILQGPDTEKEAIEELMNSILYKRAAFVKVTNYTKGREQKFRNFMNVYPLSTDSKITHYLGLTVHVEWLKSDSVDSKSNSEPSTITNSGSSENILNVEEAANEKSEKSGEARCGNDECKVVPDKSISGQAEEVEEMEVLENEKVNES